MHNVNRLLCGRARRPTCLQSTPNNTPIKQRRPTRGGPEHIHGTSGALYFISGRIQDHRDAEGNDARTETLSQVQCDIRISNKSTGGGIPFETHSVTENPIAGGGALRDSNKNSNVYSQETPKWHLKQTYKTYGYMEL